MQTCVSLSRCVPRGLSLTLFFLYLFVCLILICFFLSYLILSLFLRCPRETSVWGEHRVPSWTKKLYAILFLLGKGKSVFSYVLPLGKSPTSQQSIEPRSSRPVQRLHILVLHSVAFLFSLGTLLSCWVFFVCSFTLIFPLVLTQRENLTSDR